MPIIRIPLARLVAPLLRILAPLLAMLALLALAAPAWAAEDILDFVSTVRVEKDGALTVREDIAFPKDVVAEPDRMRRFLWWLRDNAGPLWLLTGTFTMLAWFLLTWRKHGRDPAPATIIPDWQSPKNISPAAAYWIWQRAEGAGPDKRHAFIVALISLATKGFIELDQEAGDIILVRCKPVSPDLPPDEALLMKKLFETAGHFIIGSAFRTHLSRTLDEYIDFLRKEVERTHLKSNSERLAIGAILAAIIYVGLLVLHFLGFPSAKYTFVMVNVVVVPTVLFGALIIGILTIRKKPKPLDWLIVAGGLSVIVAPFLRHALQVAPIETINQYLPPGWKSAVFIASLSLPMILLSAWYLLPRPTRLGRRVLDEIAGLEQFIATAEKERLNRLPSPDGRTVPPMSGRLFKMLPWAVAFELDKEWTYFFREWLDKAVPPVAEDHTPS